MAKSESNILVPLVDSLCEVGTLVWKMGSDIVCKKLGIKSEEQKKIEMEKAEELMKAKEQEEIRLKELEVETKNTLTIGDKKLNFNELFINCGLKNKLKDMPILEEVKNYPTVDIYSFKLPIGVTVTTVQQKIEDISDFFEVPQMNIKLQKKNGLMDIVITKENLYREVFNYSPIHFKDTKYPNNLKFVLGHYINQDYLQRMLAIDLANDDIAHTFIGASTGAGKSNLIRTIIINFILTKTPQELEIFLLDGKGGADYVVFEKSPHVFMNKCYSNPEDVCNILEDLNTEILRRNQLFKSVEVNNYNEYIKRGNTLPRRLIILDEYAIFKKDEGIFKKIQNFAGNITAQGRSAGVHMIVATQDGQKAVLESMLKYNLKTKIGFKCDNEQHSVNVCGQAGLQELKLKGVGRVFGLPRDEEYIQFKSTLAPSSEKMKKMIQSKYPNWRANIKLIDGNYRKITERELLNPYYGEEEIFEEGWGEDIDD